MGTDWSALATAISKLLLASGGFIALFFAAAQLATRRRAHLLEIYRAVFEMLDASQMRDARKYVYSIEDSMRKVFENEHWQDLAKYKTDPNYAEWKKHREMAEMVARSFDQLGLLVREGRVPVDIIARFYASPILRCWYKLTPYIESERSSGHRNQPGHFWEWEHLVSDILLEHLKDNTGVWKGVSKHDKLEDWAGKVEHELSQMLRDKVYSPPQRLWELGPWWDFRKW